MDPGFPEDAVEVGRILGAWGVKGWIRVQPFSAEPQALFSSKRWFVQPPQDAAEIPGRVWPSLLKITEAREHADAVVAGVQDLSDRDAAQALRGARIFVSRSSFPTAAADEFYWIDLIGLTVMNRAQEALGTVSGLIETGAHCVLRVDPGQDGPERLIPFVNAYVDEVDMPGRCIRVDWQADY